MSPTSTIDRLLELLDEAQREPGKAIGKVLIAALLTAGTVGGSIIGTKIFTGLWDVMMERQTFNMLQGEYDSFRADYAQTPCYARTMMNPQAAIINMRIAHEKSANRQWFMIDWSSTDRWNGVKPVDMECDTYD